MMEATRNDTASSSPMVIFGGASGIGLATACLGSMHTNSILIADLDPRGDELELVTMGRARFIQCDVTSPTSVTMALDACASHFGEARSVVTTVGGAKMRDPLELDLPSWRQEIVFNLDTAYIVATIAAARMKLHGGGAIVTTSSTLAATPLPERVAYAAAKAGVIALTKGLALAVAADNIRINCVSPHSTDTPRFRKLIGGADAFDLRVRNSPQKRISVPEDVANTILFLLSDAARSTTGQVFWVNNGSYMP